MIISVIWLVNNSSWPHLVHRAVAAGSTKHSREGLPSESGAAAGRSFPASEVRGGREETPQV